MEEKEKVSFKDAIPVVLMAGLTAISIAAVAMTGKGLHQVDQMEYGTPYKCVVNPGAAYDSIDIGDEVAVRLGVVKEIVIRVDGVVDGKIMTTNGNCAETYNREEYCGKVILKTHDVAKEATATISTKPKLF